MCLALSQALFLYHLIQSSWVLWAGYYYFHCTDKELKHRNILNVREFLFMFAILAEIFPSAEIGYVAGFCRNPPLTTPSFPSGPWILPHWFWNLFWTKAARNNRQQQVLRLQAKMCISISLNVSPKWIREIPLQAKQPWLVHPFTSLVPSSATTPWVMTTEDGGQGLPLSLSPALCQSRGLRQPLEPQALGLWNQSPSN